MLTDFANDPVWVPIILHVSFYLSVIPVPGDSALLCALLCSQGVQTHTQVYTYTDKS